VEARSDLLRNPADNKNASIRDAERGYTDRFLLKLRKPK
jgi:predicted methyltransferase